MVEELFEVATEFKFDVGQALINTQALQQAVDGVSHSANSALGSLNYLAGGLVAHLGFGAGGILSVFSQAVKISEAFNMESLNFANNISTNFNLLSGTIETFNDRLRTSQMLMGNVQRTAIEIGLPATDLANITRLIATPLAQHQRLGTNYQGGVNMAKNLMLSSEAVGLHPAVAAESLSRALTDRLALHGALFARLVNTEAFKSQRIFTQPQLMNMRTDAKIDLLNKALMQLGGDADFIANRLNRLGVQFTILKDQIEVFLKPIGEALIGPLRIMLKAANGYLRNNAENLGKNIGQFISSIIGDPKALFINLLQLKSLGQDFKKAFHFTEIFQGFLFLKWILGAIGVELNGGLLKRGLMFFYEGIAALFGFIGRLRILPMVFSLLGSAIAAVLPAFLAFLAFFQIIARARAIAHLADIKNLLDLTPQISELFVRLKNSVSNILLPITIAIDFFAKLIAPIFETSVLVNILVFVLDKLAFVLESVGMATVNMLAMLNGAIKAIVGVGFNLAEGRNPFGDLMKDFKQGYLDFTKEHGVGKTNTPTISSVVTNNNHIEARFDMREQLEPDRIAFAVTTHLKKLAISAVGAKGDHLQAAFAGSQLESGSR